MKAVETVNLTTDLGKGKTKDRKFDVAHANKVLSLTNSKWKLKDTKWKWNGTELAKA